MQEGSKNATHRDQNLKVRGRATEIVAFSSASWELSDSCAGFVTFTISNGYGYARQDSAPFQC